MIGYLLDTNIIRFWFDSKRAEHAAVDGRMQRLPASTPLSLSAISLGEIEYGHRILGDIGDPLQEKDFLDFIESRLPITLEVGRHTRTAYGTLRARLFERFSPKSRRKKVARPEELIDPTTSLDLGIQENDLWIASQVLEHNLVLVTHDKLIRIKEVAEGLRVEDWAGWE